MSLTIGVQLSYTSGTAPLLKPLDILSKYENGKKKLLIFDYDVRFSSYRREHLPLL